MNSSPSTLIAHIPQPDREIVSEWCDRYRLVIGDEFGGRPIFRLAAQIYERGLIPQCSNAVIDWKGCRL